MRIVTKTGDNGTTALMYGRRVSKTHSRVEAYGSVDELNSALGLARASTQDGLVREQLLRIQNDLVVLMGELATVNEDLERFAKDGYSRVAPEMTAKIEQSIHESEAAGILFKDWATPGASVPSAALDLARTICRRAERQVCALRESGDLQNVEIIAYLNRLADLLWLFARRAEPTKPGLKAEG